MGPDPLDELHRVLEADEDLPSPLLGALSVLEGESLRRFQGTWSALDGSTRAELLARLGQEADEDLTLDFSAVYRLGLNDPDPTVREQAFHLAAEEADERLLEIYLDAAKSDPDPSARLAAVDSLGEFTLAAQTEDWSAQVQQRLEKTLLALLHGPDSDLDLRQAALLSVAYLTTPQVETEIRQAHLQPDLREAAVLAMGRNCQDIWLTDIREEMTAPDASLRTAATAAAAELEDERLVRDLIERVHDEDPEVQDAAIRALGVIGGREAKAALSELLHAQDRNLRVAAREAIDALLMGDEPVNGLSG